MVFLDCFQYVTFWIFVIWTPYFQVASATQIIIIIILSQDFLFLREGYSSWKTLFPPDLRVREYIHDILTVPSNFACLSQHRNDVSDPFTASSFSCLQSASWSMLTRAQKSMAIGYERVT